MVVCGAGTHLSLCESPGRAACKAAISSCSGNRVPKVNIQTRNKMGECDENNSEAYINKTDVYKTTKAKQ